jgi:type IV pilus assembly protein PilF
MRREPLLLALALLAGCASNGLNVETTVVDQGPAPRPNTTKRDPGQLTNAGAVNLSLAQTYLQAGELETALNRARRAADSDPNNGNVHALLGLIFDRIGDQPKASAEFARAIALAPNTGSVLNAYGTWLCSHGDIAGAAAHFGRALADPFFTTPGLAHYNAGHCLLKAGDLVQAEASLRRALDQPGADIAAVLMSLAQVKLAQGAYFEARAFVQRREAMGATPDVLELAARIEEAAGDRAAAARYRARARGESGQPGGEATR